MNDAFVTMCLQSASMRNCNLQWSDERYGCILCRKYMQSRTRREELGKPPPPSTSLRTWLLQAVKCCSLIWIHSPIRAVALEPLRISEHIPFTTCSLNSRSGGCGG